MFFDLRQIHVAVVARALVWIDALDDSVEEPLELEEFLTNVQLASAIYLEDLLTFKPQPREF